MATIVPLAPAGLTPAAVASRGLSDLLGHTPEREVCDDATRTCAWMPSTRRADLTATDSRGRHGPGASCPARTGLTRSAMYCCWGANALENGAGLADCGHCSYGATASACLAAKRCLRERTASFLAPACVVVSGAGLWRVRSKAFGLLGAQRC